MSKNNEMIKETENCMNCNYLDRIFNKQSMTIKSYNCMKLNHKFTSVPWMHICEHYEDVKTGDA